MIKSPCISICKIDPKTDLCLGCSRTLQEIANWAHLNDEGKKNVIKEANKRKDLINK